MGIKDLLGKGKDMAGELATKGKEFAEEHSDQVRAGIDKVEGLADKAT